MRLRNACAGAWTDCHGAAAGGGAAPLRSRDARPAALSETLPRESRGFHMAFQLALLEAREAVEAVLAERRTDLARSGDADPHWPAELHRRRPADAVRSVPRKPRDALRHDMEALASRFGVSFEQACHRLSTPAAARRTRRAVFLSAGRSRRATYRNVSPRPAFRSRATAGPVRAGSCTPPSPGRARCWCRSPNCRTAQRIFALRAR